MDWTPLNILFMTLAVCTVVLTIFISITLFNLTMVLHDTEKIVDRVNRFIAQPIRIAAKIAQGVEKVIAVVEERITEASKKRR